MVLFTFLKFICLASVITLFDGFSSSGHLRCFFKVLDTVDLGSVNECPSTPALSNANDSHFIQSQKVKKNDWLV